MEVRIIIIIVITVFLNYIQESEVSSQLCIWMSMSAAAAVHLCLSISWCCGLAMWHLKLHCTPAFMEHFCIALFISELKPVNWGKIKPNMVCNPMGFAQGEVLVIGYCRLMGFAL